MRYASTIASHEIGHGFGLQHDGDSNYPGSILGVYYGGRPGAGNTSWGAIMGGSECRDAYAVRMQGECDGATNFENDLATIAGAIGVDCADDHGNSLNTGGSTLLTAQRTADFSASGVIGGSTGTGNGNDVDVFRFNAGSAAD